MTNFVNNIGIAFSGADAFLNADGWIKVYDDDTDELDINVAPSSGSSKSSFSYHL